MRSDRRGWRRQRSPHARVLEGLEAAIAAHPASSGRRTEARPDDDRVGPSLCRIVSIVPDDEGPDAA